MGQAETNIQNRILLAYNSAKSRLWRNHVGFGYQSEHIQKYDNAVILTNARPVKFGLGPGSSDTIGFTTITVTPEMVGKPVAIFTAFEVKTPTGKASQIQKKFIDMVRNLGGIAGVTRSVEDVKLILHEYQQRCTRSLDRDNLSSDFDLEFDSQE